tara:strand:+ start:482 stop:1393 length:912 start_codon:yes stop_codon:yes gene_type:complete
MSADKEKLIAELVNKGLDGDMDSVNACEDKIIRGKAKAMIMKVKKGTIERPPKPEPAANEKIDPKTPESLSKDEMISYLVNKGLDGDMDTVNACEDKIVRGKAKAMIMKVKKGTLERPEMPIFDSPVSSGEPHEENTQNDDKDTFQKIKKLIYDKFPNSIIENEEGDYIQIKPDEWNELAVWLKSEPSLLFDSLQCQMGIDIGDDKLESRYNLHSMELDHYIEIRIAVPRSDAKIPSVEQVWRIADWFERETYDMLGIEYTGHRDLRRILLPDDWEGWPLRKDYQVQETYHGIVVPKMKEGWE